MIKRKSKFNIIFLILILTAVFFRLIFLDRFPTGISNDELHFILNSKAVFYRFTDMSGRWFPLSFSVIPDETSSEFPFLFLAPFVGPLPTNLFTARLPFALVGVLSLILIFFITLRLTNNTNLALVALLVGSLNPWSIYVNRTSFDAPLAIFFYLLCLFFMISTKPKYVLLSVIPGILAFYSYIGTKVIYFPFIFGSSYILYKYFKRSKLAVYYLSISLFSLLLSFIFLFSLNKSNLNQRTSELLLPDSPSVLSQVFLEKSQSLQSPFKIFLTNNIIVYFRNFVEKYLNNFSPDIFFLTGDHTYMISLWKHGYFFYIDALFLILGLLYLFKHYPKFLLLILFFISISPLPEAIRADKIPAYAFHSSLQYPFIFIIIAAGILYFWQLFNTKILRIIFVFVYLFSFILFLDFYFFKYPVYQPEGFSFSRRIASRFLFFESQKNRDIYFLTPESNTLFRSYLFYTNNYQSISFDLVKNIYSQSRDHIIFNHIHFINDPKYLPKTDMYTLLYDDNKYSLNQDDDKILISNISDAGHIFSIIRPQTCSDDNLDPFTHNLNLFDLNIEKLTESEFCRKFITKNI